MEHFWTPFFTFLSGIVVSVGVPYFVWKRAQAEAAKVADAAEAEEERDYQLENVRWVDYHTHVSGTFGLLFQAWREGKDLNLAMAAMDRAVASYPRPVKLKKS